MRKPVFVTYDFRILDDQAHTEWANLFGVAKILIPRDNIRVTRLFYIKYLNRIHKIQWAAGERYRAERAQNHDNESRVLCST